MPRICEICGREEEQPQEVQESVASDSHHLYLCEGCIEDRQWPI